MAELKMIDPKKIQPNPYNPRKDFNKDTLRELAQSIQELGLLQPPTVYPSDGRTRQHDYTVLCGECRVRACLYLKLKEIPCNVVDPPTDKAQAIKMALVENLQREDLSVQEEAPAIVELVDSGMKRSDIAKALGKSPEYINTRYHLAHYPEVLAFLGSDKCSDSMESLALVGQIETPEIRARILKYAAKPGNHLRYVHGDLNEVRKCENRDLEDLKARSITEWVEKYHNSKAKILKCVGDGYGADKEKCKHHASFSKQVSDFLGIKTKGANWRGQGVCMCKNRTCLEYKRDREKLIREKLKKVKKDRLLKKWYGSDPGMEDAKFGRRACKGCKSRYKVPDYFQGYGHGYAHPYVYCTAEESECFDEKLAAWETKEKPANWRQQKLEEAGALKDEELQKEVDEQLTEEREDSLLEYIDKDVELEVLANRGWIPQVKIEVTWTKWDPPDTCPPGATCDWNGQACPTMCPHQVNGGPGCDHELEASDEGAAA